MRVRVLLVGWMLWAACVTKGAPPAVRTDAASEESPEAATIDAGPPDGPPTSDDADAAPNDSGPPDIAPIVDASVDADPVVDVPVDAPTAEPDVAPASTSTCYAPLRVGGTPLEWFCEDAAVPVDAEVPVVDDASVAEVPAASLSIPWAGPAVLTGGPDEHFPMAADPAGTVYLGGARFAGVRSIVRDHDLPEPGVVGIAADGRVVVTLPPFTSMRILPEGLSADREGFYVFASYDAAIDLPGFHLDAPTAPSSCLIAFDRAGAVRWGHALGAAFAMDSARVSTRSPGRVVVVGLTNGVVALDGLRAGELGATHVVRIDLTPAGRATSVRDVASGVGALAVLENAGGGMLLQMDRGEILTARLRLGALESLAPDGTTRWRRIVPSGTAVIDDTGGAYVVSHDVCEAFALVHFFSFCVAAIGPTGRGRWVHEVWTPVTEDLVLRDALWQDGGLRVRYVHEYALYGGTCSSTYGCSGYARRDDAIYLDAAGLAATPTTALRERWDLFGSRRCWGRQWARSCGNEGAPIAGVVSCGGAGPGCADGLDLTRDSANCGACGHDCGRVFAHQAGRCAQSACRPGACLAGWASCDGDPDNGCEVDLTATSAHCGACGRACAAGSLCRDGRCCVGSACDDGPYASDGREGPFAPTRDVVLDGVHAFTTVTIPAGVTVRSTTGVLELRATGAVRIDGVIDLSGRPGGGCATAVAPPGASPGADGSLRWAGCTAGSGPTRPAPDTRPEAVYLGGIGEAFLCQGCTEEWGCHRSGCEYVGSEPTGGSIGIAAWEDLAVQRVFEAGSRGGGYDGFTVTSAGVRTPACRVGGAGGGALRVSSPVSVTLGVGARTLARGGDWGGSGGVVVLRAPEVRVPAGAVVDAAGGTGGGVGRVRVSVDPARCTLAGSFLPPLSDGCRETPPQNAVGRASVGAWPL